MLSSLGRKLDISFRDHVLIIHLVDIIELQQLPELDLHYLVLFDVLEPLSEALLGHLRSRWVDQIVHHFATFVDCHDVAIQLVFWRVLVLLFLVVHE